MATCVKALKGMDVSEQIMKRNNLQADDIAVNTTPSLIRE